MSRDPVCAPCLRASRGTRPANPAWLWDSAPMREVLARGDLPAFVALVRATMGLSQLELASLVGWSQSTVNRIERGERGTLYDVRELVRFADAIDMPRHALLPLIMGKPVAIDDFAGTNPDMEMDRRHFAGVLAGGLVVGMGWGSAEIPARVDVAHLRFLEATLRRLWVQDQQIGGGVLLGPALRRLAGVRRMLDEADCTEAVGHRLLSMAGELCLCAGWLAYDSGHRDAARQLYGEAYLYSGQAGDEQLRVNVASYLAMQAVRDARRNPGRAREALRMVAVGRDAARGWATPRVYALLAIREATAQAALGEQLPCRRAIATAWREIERGGHDDDPEWTGFLTPNVLTYFEGLTTMVLSRPLVAVDRFQRLLADPELGERNRLYYRSCLANALLASGETADALAEGMDLLARVSGSRRTLEELAPLRDAAGASSEFAELYDHKLAA
ncbi:helix-turn-helix transcriptional regulator [Sphaerisporangium sp. NPDC051017]|uniref:helix-turn-helix domain-containing protein n=1 Tax=Sphaerisporangium sp. NPDC051017 TaxID=3154636 RepID=UPI003417201E